MIAAPVFLRRCERCQPFFFFLISRPSNWLVNHVQAASDTHDISVTPVVYILCVYDKVVPRCLGAFLSTLTCTSIAAEEQELVNLNLYPVGN